MVHNTGDKFVIEIGEVIERHGEPPLYKIAGFNALVFDEFGLNRLGKLTNGVDAFSYGKGFIDGANTERNIIRRAIEKIDREEK